MHVIKIRAFAGLARTLITEFMMRDDDSVAEPRDQIAYATGLPSQCQHLALQNLVEMAGEHRQLGSIDQTFEKQIVEIALKRRNGGGYKITELL